MHIGDNNSSEDSIINSEENKECEGLQGQYKVAKEIRERGMRVAEDMKLINCTQWKLSRDIS